MDLCQLNIFCKVIELKSFSRAGKAIHLSQPTVADLKVIYEGKDLFLRVNGLNGQTGQPLRFSVF
jgi:hypothetical protein